MELPPRFAIILLILTMLTLLLTAGCTWEGGRDKESIKDSIEPLPTTRPSLPAYSGTVIPVSNKDIDEIKDALYLISQEWESNTVSCSSNSCTGNFFDTAGNTVAIRATLYSSIEEAHSAYEAEKLKGSTFRDVSIPQVGDESYGWQHLTTAELGVRKSNLVAIFDYGAATGAATISQVREIATMVMDNL